MTTATGSKYGSNSILSQPSVKFFISQIIRAGLGAQRLQLALKRCNQQSLPLRCIWLQGDLLEWQDDGDALLLDDGTGSYVMAIGEILHITKDQVIIRALKMADLSSNPDTMTIWLYETIDLHQTIFEPCY
ncbi:uncharacterized protein TRIADDRAFT_57881 [Trichoplax adhaerens]|uniref:Uncharacterized protein n=1 Tax=Trichoplax adhaerens TaxID=10228 RepID=B3S1T8_TRIAD|nr:hypothetical protein TRIADDRAFT_57881 [Trichoplax adhaerens]EDV23349.1 hypothetical protein TRIADDRAFT_57881 [Trichoplax adhaerens]|eukprot:XP_002114259.1 hypothetical protein TRIADDRAFT_57881 [Trichoplax adhaerens]